MSNDNEMIVVVDGLVKQFTSGGVIVPAVDYLAEPARCPR